MASSGKGEISIKLSTQGKLGVNRITWTVVPFELVNGTVLLHLMSRTCQVEHFGILLNDGRLSIEKHPQWFFSSALIPSFMNWLPSNKVFDLLTELLQWTVEGNLHSHQMHVNPLQKINIHQTVEVQECQLISHFESGWNTVFIPIVIWILFVIHSNE